NHLLGFPQAGSEKGTSTETAPEGTTPKEGTPNETAAPPEVTTTPQVTTIPQEVTTTPPEVATTPQEVTTTPPEVTTTPQEATTTPPEVTTTPQEVTTTPPKETTTPGGVVTPDEDLPADEDGYQYPEFFANLVRQTILDKKLFYEIHDGINYRYLVENKTPEIVFVERGESVNGELNPIIIYAQFHVDEAGQKNICVRMSFTTGTKDFAYLKFPHLYSSYAEYVEAVQTALQNRAELANADISDLLMEQDEINAGLGENFAKFVGEKFVDASINCVRFYSDSTDGHIVREISGFAYDTEGKSHSYVVKLQCKSDLLLSDKQIIEGVEAGTLTRADFETFESTSKQISSVFEEQVNEV
ncbi:MAG: hypothetical protein IJV73_01010, partial [Clostridia bacterium]|nr:hypothetical protein [Clostridia bacterium]